MNTLPVGFSGTLSQYRSVHLWVEKRLGKPLHCSRCSKSEGTTRNFNWCNISGSYIRELSDWIRLCKSCHTLFDRKKLFDLDKCVQGHSRKIFWAIKKDGRGYCKRCSLIYKQKSLA